MAEVFEVAKLKKFNDDKRHNEIIWSDDHAKISLLCLKPGQEVITHTHHGSHIWTVIEGKGEMLAGKNSSPLASGRLWLCLRWKITASGILPAKTLSSPPLRVRATDWVRMKIRYNAVALNKKFWGQGIFS